MVQSSAHGHDHRALLDALAAAPGRLRGVALLGPDSGASEIRRLHEAGVRGFRLNFLPHLGPGPTRRQIDEHRGLVAELGWSTHVHVHDLAGADNLVRAVPGRIVLDHLGRADLSRGPDRAVTVLRRLLDTGRVWVKVSGVDRISLAGPPYADGVALAAAVVAHAPGRVLWGTDYPHVNIAGAAPDDGLLVDLLARIAPDPGDRYRLLVENPAEVFDFPPLVSSESRSVAGLVDLDPE